jgi:hypothetical protein
MVLDSIIPIELDSFNLIGSVGTTKLGMFRPAMPMQLVIEGPGQTDCCHLPLKNHGVVHLSLELCVLPSNNEATSITVEPEQVEIPPGQLVEAIIWFTATRHLEEPDRR